MATRFDAVQAADVQEVLELNRDYIRAVRNSDVDWFSQMVSADFRCSLPDGSILDKQAFIARAAQPLDIADLEVHDVEVRIFGQAAIVHARTTFRTAGGESGFGRYTDVWARQDGRWSAVAAHFTRSIG